ncbi:MAG: helix-turn-helix transcriptional regulator [Atopobium sp.]|uniref:helix-turn-helix domain-containing protein n=1 Tax=Atopobium sp. TaxID=1872650 RepID=UPI002A827AEE|nr:helix-turn-helix transcriptional regulator [Atopobium sp.]MDY4523077.1 helix-turn-helix transcriptional regulator [Atopobium sp.]
MERANNYRKFRELAGMRPEAVASALGVSIQTLYKWENDKTSPSAEKLRKMAVIYNCSSDELICLDN